MKRPRQGSEEPELSPIAMAAIAELAIAMATRDHEESLQARSRSRAGHLSGCEPASPRAPRRSASASDDKRDLRNASKAAGRRRGARGEAGKPVIAEAMTSTKRD